jgi:hypothetical protein
MLRPGQRRRRECVGHVGAEGEAGEADLLQSPLDFLGHGRRVIGKDRQRVRGAQRSRVGIARCHDWRD